MDKQKEQPIIRIQISVEKGGLAKEIVFTKLSETPGVDLKQLLDIIQRDFLTLYRAVNPFVDERNN